MKSKQKKEVNVVDSIVEENKLFLLKLRLAQKQEKLLQSRKKRKELQRKASSYYIELKAYKDEIKRKNQIIKDLQEDADTLYNSLRKKEDIKHQIIFSKKLKEKDKEIKELKKNNKELLSSINKLESKLSRKQEELEDSFKKIESLQLYIKDVDKLRELTEQKALALSSFNQRIKQLEQELSISDASNQQLLVKISELSDYIDNMKQMIKEKEIEIKERDTYYPILIEMENILKDKEK